MSTATSTSQEKGLDVSVEVDLADLGFDADDALAGNVFLEPAPLELCPWGAQSPSGHDGSDARGTEVHASIAWHGPPASNVPKIHDETRWDSPLPRFSFLSPEPPPVGDGATPLGLPRFSETL